jgi:hypothetical protein
MGTEARGPRRVPGWKGQQGVAAMEKKAPLSLVIVILMLATLGFALARAIH